MVPSDGSDIISYPYEHDKSSMRDVIVRASIIPLANYSSLGLDAETVYSRKEGRKEIRGGGSPSSATRNRLTQLYAAICTDIELALSLPPLRLLDSLPS